MKLAFGRELNSKNRLKRALKTNRIAHYALCGFFIVLLFFQQITNFS